MTEPDAPQSDTLNDGSVPHEPLRAARISDAATSMRIVDLRNCFMSGLHDTLQVVKSTKTSPRRTTKSPPSRLQRHRAEMRKRGFKLVQLWVPDPTAPGFRNAVRRTREFLKNHPDRDWDSFALRTLDAAPGWSDR